jgi:hypothetical protein
LEKPKLAAYRERACKNVAPNSVIEAGRVDRRREIRGHHDRLPIAQVRIEHHRGIVLAQDRVDLLNVPVIAAKLSEPAT